MDQERIDRACASLRRAKLDALVLRLPENIVMATGAWPDCWQTYPYWETGFPPF